MAKNERKRTMVYSNVNKHGRNRADAKSASNNNEVIDLDEEFVIGLASFPKPEGAEKRNKNESEEEGTKSGQPVEKLSQKIKNRLFKKKKNNNDDDEFFIGMEDNNQSNVKKKSKKKNMIKKIIIKNNQNKKDNESNTIKSNQPQKTNNATKKIKKINVNQNQKKNIPISKEERIKMQKRRAIKRMSACALLLVLLIGGLVYFLLSPVFNVKSIEVVNNNHISSEQIINASEISLNENMFKFSKREVRNKLLANPYIEKVTIKRNIFTDKVKIDVKERVATLMLEYGNSYVYINNQGYILEISSVKIDSPILKGYVTNLDDVQPGHRLNNEDLQRLEDVLSIIEAANSKEIGDLITQIDISDKKDYIMVLESEDKTVHLGDDKNLSTKMLYVKDMLEREKGIEGEFFLNMDLNIKDPMFREKV